jgi:hypothetical protein
MVKLPSWTDWDEQKRMSVVAFYRYWFLFDQNGQPHVVRRRKVFNSSSDPSHVDPLLDEEICDLYGEGEDMTPDARGLPAAVLG